MLNFIKNTFSSNDNNNNDSKRPADSSSLSGWADFFSLDGMSATRSPIGRVRPATKVAGSRRNRRGRRHFSKAALQRKHDMPSEASEQDLISMSGEGTPNAAARFVSDGPKWSEMPTRKRGAKRTHRVKVNQPRNRGCN